MLKYRYSKLRESMIGSWCPSMGAYGNLLPDRSGRNNHGTLTNGPTWEASAGGGKSGLSVSYDGSNDYVSVNNVFAQVNVNISIATWFYNRGSFTAYASLFDAGTVGTNRQLTCFLGGSTSQLYCAVRGSGGAFINLSTTLLANTWTPLVMTHGGTGINIYVNGVLAGTTASGSGSAYNAFAELQIGGNPSAGGATYFNGLQDATSLFNCELTSPEIATLAKYRGIEHEIYSVPVVRGSAVSGPTYTLTADEGTFTLSGQDVSLKANRNIAADNASFTLSGQTASLKAARKLTLDNGSFALSGQTAALLAARKIVAETGGYTLAGQDASLVYGTLITLVADHGSFALSGQDAALVVTRRMTAEAGSFTLTGQSATLTYSGAAEIPCFTIDFVSNNQTTGTLELIAATGSLQIIESTGTLAVTETEV